MYSITVHISVHDTAIHIVIFTNILSFKILFQRLLIPKCLYLSWTRSVRYFRLASSDALNISSSHMIEVEAWMFKSHGREILGNRKFTNCPSLRCKNSMKSKTKQTNQPNPPHSNARCHIFHNS